MRTILPLMVMALASLGMPLGVAAAEPGAPLGSAVVVAGTVLVTHRHDAAAGATAAPLSFGAAVHDGDMVRTGEDGRVQLLLSDASLLNLGPATEVSLGTKPGRRGRASTSVRVGIGKLWARISHLLSDDPEFEVVSGNAVAGVRGTSLFMEVEADATTATTVLRGTVALTDAQGTKLFLKAMQRGLARHGQPLALSDVSPEALAALQAALATNASMDPERLKGLWLRLGAANAKAAAALSAAESRKALRRTLSGRDPTTAPQAPLNLEPPVTDAIIHGHIVGPPS